MILTQQQLILELRGYGIQVTSTTIHAWIRAGCPSIPGWRKPRFLLNQVIEWIRSVRQVDPLVMEVRDRQYLRGLRKNS
jgi:hypothetical protein